MEASSSKPLYRPVPKTEGSGTPASATGGCEEDAMRLNMASATASDVAMTIQTLRMEVEDKDKTILMLQKALVGGQVTSVSAHIDYVPTRAPIHRPNRES